MNSSVYHIFTHSETISHIVDNTTHCWRFRDTLSREISERKEYVLWPDVLRSRWIRVTDINDSKVEYPDEIETRRPAAGLRPGEFVWPWTWHWMHNRDYCDYFRLCTDCDKTIRFIEFLRISSEKNLTFKQNKEARYSITLKFWSLILFI